MGDQLKKLCQCHRESKQMLCLHFLQDCQTPPTLRSGLTGWSTATTRGRLSRPLLIEDNNQSHASHEGIYHLPMDNAPITYGQHRRRRHRSTNQNREKIARENSNSEVAAVASAVRQPLIMPSFKSHSEEDFLTAAASASASRKGGCVIVGGGNCEAVEVENIYMELDQDRDPVWPQPQIRKINKTIPSPSSAELKQQQEPEDFSEDDSFIVSQC